MINKLAAKYADFLKDGTTGTREAALSVFLSTVKSQGYSLWEMARIAGPDAERHLSQWEKPKVPFKRHR
jgi:hypothetical protein